jgi:FMN phosphatase YigB (HAD superfamily)
MKYIFVDLDNTLVAVEELWKTPPKNSKVITLDTLYFTEKYFGKVRPEALQLLESLRSIAPTYMLTAAATDYARAWNKEFNLGFKEEDIYAREDTGGKDLSIGDKFLKKGDVYLIDDKDLPYYNTEIKVRFLKNLGKLNLVIVRPFYGHKNQVLDVKSILDKIV